MSLKRIEDELLGISAPRPILATDRVSKTMLVDDGSGGVEMVDAYPGDPLDVEENPYFPAVMNRDGGARHAYHEYAAQEAEGPPSGAGPAPPPPGSATDVSDLQMEEVVGRQDAQENAAGAEAPWVRITPRSASVAVLGGQAEIGSPNTEPVEVVRWVGREIEATALSVAWTPVNTYVASATLVLRPFMRLRYGTRNSIISVDVDIGQGGQLSIPASVVYVLVGLDAGSNVPTSSPPYRLSAGIGYFGVSRFSAITRTSYIDNLAAAGNTIITRPTMAASIIGFERADPAASYTLQFLNWAGTIISQRVIGANQYLTAPIILGNDTQFITVVNNGAGTDNARLIFGLAL